MSDLVEVSFSLEEIQNIKASIMEGRLYSDRVSFGLALRIFDVGRALREVGCIFDELDYLEGMAAFSKTKEAGQFRHHPLDKLWHKHFYSPRHFVKNIGIHWGIDRDKTKKLDNLIREVTRKNGNDLDFLPASIAHRFVLDAYMKRASGNRLTGDWIIFGKYEGKNYYLDIAAHEEGDNPDRLLEKLRKSSKSEFPFLFV